MTRTDPDVAAVRQLPPGLVEPTDASVSRTWHAVTARRAVRERPRTRLRFLIPVTAALVVSGLAVGAAVLFAPGGSGAPLPPGGGGAPLQPGAAPVLGGAIEVSAAMDRLIASGASASPLPVADGQLIYVHTQELATAVGAEAETGQGEVAPKSSGAGRPGAQTAGGGTGQTLPAPENHQMWLDPQGMIALGIVRNGEDLTKGPKANHEAQVAEARQRLAAAGPSLFQPTPPWLAALPTDPARLRAQILAGIGENKWSEEHRLVTALGDLLWVAEPVLTPQVRVALYRVLAGVDGLTAAEISIDGRAFYAFRHAEAHSADDLLFDPLTGRAAGRGSAAMDDGPQASPAPPVGPGTYQSLWTYAIVARVGQTQ